MSSKALTAQTNSPETGRSHTHRKSKHSSHHTNGTNGDSVTAKKAAPPIKESLRLILDAAEKAPSRQILILTPNDYKNALEGGVCKPVYERVLATSAGAPAGKKAIEIKKMPNVARE